MMKRLFAFVFILTLSLAGMAKAVTPAEMLPDPNQEARARALSSQLRCVVCQSQSIDDSDAEMARDLRAVVREHIVAGDSDQQIKDYLVARYGYFILLKPPLSWETLLLWGSPLLLVFMAVLAIVGNIRRNKNRAQAAPLTPSEQAALDELMQYSQAGAKPEK